MIGLAFKILSNNQLKRFSCIITFSLNGRGRQNQNCKNLTFINSSNEYRYSSCIYIYFHETQLAIKTIVMTNHGCLLHLELILKHKETNKKFRKPYRQPPGSSSGTGGWWGGLGWLRFLCHSPPLHCLYHSNLSPHPHHHKCLKIKSRSSLKWLLLN